jgi:hypothetical protein
MSGLTRGRLPARVYWVRRLGMLGIAILLVVGMARLLGGSGGGSGGDEAANVGDTTTLGTPSAPVSHPAHHPRKQADDPVTPVVMPSGPCAASDVAITPSVPKPVGGSNIAVVLNLTSVTTPACSWTLSPQSLAMKITSGPDLIWTTAECSRSIPTQDLVLRQSTPTRVRLTWDARRSEPGCPARTAWARTGTYHLEVAALAGQPQDVTFLLTAPSQATGTTTTRSSSGHDGKTHHQHGKKHKRHKKKQPPPG